MLRTLSRLAVVALLLPAPAAAQQTAGDWAAVVANEYRIATDITYLTADGWDAQLDVYTPRTPGPHPTILHIHGGGWVGGTREGVALRLLPYLEMGFAVVNVSYRLGRIGLAPAAVEDCLCALRWIVRNAEQYGFDTDRIVTMGYSAGGHLALTTAMIPEDEGLANICPGSEPLRVAAVVNWYGITDVADLMEGENERSYTVQWLGGQPDRAAVARRVSPLTYVRRDLPPILTIHGDADPTVPYDHAVQLHEALNRAGAGGELVTVPGGGHGNFPADQQVRVLREIRDFFRTHRLLHPS
ncbi:MAG TPA: alpha/beta hydrolase [Longimicrobiaceae bacterium]|nr:alpha/beta hydrolase [Longimicrobiaceae bacterium]